ncbi:MAG: hypothetical protein HQ591_08335 [candidate division Zixibacteria bacterium]|nr:hypothetical protein [Candidatus Tariuqbacter arcticus]
MKRKFLTAALFALLLPAVTFIVSGSNTIGNISDFEHQARPQEESNAFNTAWQNYKGAFQPISEAITSGSYQSLRSFLPHFKDTARALKKAKTPDYTGDALKKAVKKVLIGTKALLKAAKSGKRAKIQEHYNRLKEAIEMVEVIRNRHQ